MVRDPEPSKRETAAQPTATSKKLREQQRFAAVPKKRPSQLGSKDFQLAHVSEQ